MALLGVEGSRGEAVSGLVGSRRRGTGAAGFCTSHAVPTTHGGKSKTMVWIMESRMEDAPR
jgi:hypothetical protein